MPIKLTMTQETRAKTAIGALFSEYYLCTDPKTTIVKGQLINEAGNSPSLMGAITNLCEEIIHRGFTFLSKTLDSALTEISVCWIRPERYYNSGRFHLSQQEWANSIAWFCEQNNIYWDDTNLTTYEIDAIKDTILGGTLIKYGLFVNQLEVVSSTGSRAPSSKAPGSPPANGYKASGAHSQDIPNLVGSAHNKVHLPAPIFAIEADKVGKNVPNAFITPLKTTNTTVVPVSKAEAEKIRFGSGNGYTDCKLWFKDYATADAVRAHCQANYGSKFTGIKVVKYNYTGITFFEVSTATVNAYIKASKLNEELDAALEQINGDYITESAEEEETSKLSSSSNSIFAAMTKAKADGKNIDLVAFEEGMNIGRA